MEILRATPWLVLHTLRSAFIALLVGGFVYLTCNAFPPTGWFPSSWQAVFNSAGFWIAVAVTVAAFVVAWHEE